jgi:hypothetical protein
MHPFHKSMDEKTTSPARAWNQVDDPFSKYIPSCSSLITWRRLLDYMTSCQLEFTENIAGVLLTLRKNMLGIIENSLRTWSCAHSH